jgi:hypothetical protein
MKSYLWYLSIILIGMRAQVLSAGGVIKLSNKDINIPIVINNISTNIIDDSYFVEVYAGPIGGRLSPLKNSSNGKSRLKLQATGFFEGNYSEIPGVLPGDFAEFQVRIWKGMPSYDMALGFGKLTGLSEKWHQKVGIAEGINGKSDTRTILQVPKAFYYTGSVDPIKSLALYGVKEEDLKD